MSNAKRSLGTSISIGVTAIGELTEIMSPELTAEEIDVTTLSSTSGFREYVQGFLDSGTLDISGFFYPGDAGQAAVKAAFDAGTISTFTITYPAAVGATWVFQGFISKFKGGDATIEDPLTFECSIRITGATTLGTTASANLTGLEVLADNGVAALGGYDITPVFAAATYKYAATYNTDTDFTVKATSATHTMKLYIDDVYIQDLTTATASAVQLQSADTTKIIKVVAWETAKTPKTYTIALARTA